MKVGFDAKRIFHNFRGLGNYSRTLVESLIKHHPENSYTLFTPRFKDKRALEWRKRFNKLEVVEPVTGIGKAFSSTWRSLMLAPVIKEKGIEIFHGLSHELPPGLRRRGIKSVVTIHDLIFLRFPHYFPWVDRQVYFHKVTHAVQSADIVLAICEQTKRDLITYINCPEEKIRVVFQSCHPSFYSGLKNEELEKVREIYSLPEHYILTVGAIEERKNALSLVQAFSRIKDLIPHDLILIGDGKDYRKKVEKEILEHGLKDRIRIESGVNSDHLPAIYQAADLFVYPSFFEGWGIPIVEALFSDTPVITSAGSCFPESGGPGSVYVNPHSVEDIAEKMEKVLFDDDLSASMVRQGRAHAELFHWKNTSAELIKVYKELL